MERQETTKTIAGDERVVERGSEVTTQQAAIIEKLAEQAANIEVRVTGGVDQGPIGAQIFKVLVACHIQNKNIRENQERSARIQAEMNQVGGQLSRNIAPPQAYRESTIGDI